MKVHELSNPINDPREDESSETLGVKELNTSWDKSKSQRVEGESLKRRRTPLFTRDWGPSRDPEARESVDKRSD